ncbi:trypsin-like serine protease [Streptomyces collinus]|uniref:trypsin-like serine protease n=1 Tax=Streptomyces collinus TaxID=42684 RepID=UPI003334579E
MTSLNLDEDAFRPGGAPVPSASEGSLTEDRLGAAGSPTLASRTRGAAFGWGRDGYGGVAPCRLTSVPLRFVAQQHCSTAQRGLGPVPDTKRQVCAVPDANARRNTWTGDSGSPVCDTEDHDPVVGLVSWGPSRRIDDVGVYVRVASPARWIARATSQPPANS